jgi:hypothetical protein
VQGGRKRKNGKRVFIYVRVVSLKDTINVETQNCILSGMSCLGCPVWDVLSDSNLSLGCPVWDVVSDSCNLSLGCPV